MLATILAFLLVLQIQPPWIVSRLLQVQVVTRHCDRLPTTARLLPNYPELDPVVLLNASLGTLTQVGLGQCYVVGSQLRDRYLNDGSPFCLAEFQNRPAVYDDRLFRFYSTSFRRSLRSVEAISQGLFPPSSSTPRVDVPVVFPPFGALPGDTALPSDLQPVPIRTIAKKNDRALLGYRGSSCGAIHEMSEESELKKQAEVYLRPSVEAIANLSGIPDLTFDDVYPVYDTLHVLWSHDLLPPELEELYFLAKNVSDQTFYLVFGREAVGTLGAGELVRKILDEMDLMIHRDEIVGGARRFVEEDPHHPMVERYRRHLEEPEVQDPRTYVHYGSHDATLGALFSALRLNEDHVDLQSGPLYGAAVAFELHEDEADGHFFVRIVYRNGWDSSFEVYELLSLGVEQGHAGCQGQTECLYQVFRAAALADAVPVDWCTECQTGLTADVCLAEKIDRLESQMGQDFVLITVLSIVSGFFLVLSVVLGVVVCLTCCCDAPCSCISENMKTLGRRVAGWFAGRGSSDGIEEKELVDPSPSAGQTWEDPEVGEVGPGPLNVDVVEADDTQSAWQ